METISSDSKTAPLIPRRTLYLSLALAAVTEVLWIAAQILQRPAAPSMFVMTLGWPFYYAICLGMAFGLAWTVKTGGMMGPDYDVSSFLPVLRILFPRPLIKRLQNIILMLGLRFALFGFSLVLGVMAAAACYADVTHRWG